MKIKFYPLLAFCCIGTLSAQEMPGERMTTRPTPAELGKSIVKTNVTAYLFRNINLSYEYVISRRVSLQASYSFIPEGSIPYAKSFTEGNNLEELSAAVMSYSSITFEPRFYLNSRGYGSGFYLATYYRHSKLEVAGATLDFDSEGIENKADLSGKVNANSFGLLIGTQWMLGAKQNWVLDFSILGGHYGSSDGNLIAVSSRPLSPQEQADLQQELDDLDIPVVKIDAKANANGATAKVSGPWAGLRFGLSLGYRF